MIRKDINARVFMAMNVPDEMDLYDRSIIQLEIGEETHTGKASHFFELSVAEADEIAGKIGEAIRKVSNTRGKDYEIRVNGKFPEESLDNESRV